MIERKKKILIITLIILIIIALIIKVRINAMTVNSENNNPGGVITVNPAPKKILIYHTHTLEKNMNSTVIDIGEDLSVKLRNKGYEVEHITTNFSKDYNKAYYASAEMLKTKNLKDYALIIDMHINAGGVPTAVMVNDNPVAQAMFVQTKTNPYLEDENDRALSIGQHLLEFGKIYRGVYANYKVGIKHYNLALSNNMLLLEAGNNLDDFLSVKRMNTYLSASIDLNLKEME